MCDVRTWRRGELGGPWLGTGLGRATRLGRMRVSELSIGISRVRTAWRVEPPSHDFSAARSHPARPIAVSDFFWKKQIVHQTGRRTSFSVIWVTGMYFLAKSPMGKRAENRRQKYLNDVVYPAGDVVARAVLPYTAAHDGHRHLPRGADHRDRIDEPHRPRLQGRDRDGPPSHSPWRASHHRSSATLRRSTRISVATSASAPEHVASTIAQIALRDDYDPVVFLFCLNAIFLSVVINVVNYGMEKDEETGMLKMPEGGFAAVLTTPSAAWWNT